MLSTWLTRDCGLTRPIICAPMAGIALGRLASAVSRAGGLGMIGIGLNDPLERAAAEASVAREGGRFGIGLMAWAVERRPELLDAALAERPFAVALSFGDVRPYAERVRASGALLLTQVNTLDDARAAERAGVDAIVAQGTEAGGHTGAVGTLPLLQLVLDAVRVPVIAAGGIATARGLAAVLAAGADGAWIGTPLIASPEAETPDAARAHILAAREGDTVLTSLFDRMQSIPWPNGRPGRALYNDFARTWHGREDEAVADPHATARYRAAKERGDFDVLQIYAGQAVGTLETARPAGEIIAGIADGAEMLLRERAVALLPGD
jgi:nitronate monooxygenase